MILTLRTDKPEAEIGLYADNLQLSHSWPAHRQLAETIHSEIKKLLDTNGQTLTDLKGLVVYKGPGSFTGLRICISVANALADGLGLPIVGETGVSWKSQGIARLEKKDNDRIVIPEYGSPPHTTSAKH